MQRLTYCSLHRYIYILVLLFRGTCRTVQDIAERHQWHQSHPRSLGTLEGVERPEDDPRVSDDVHIPGKQKKTIAVLLDRSLRFGGEGDLVYKISKTDDSANTVKKATSTPFDGTQEGLFLCGLRTFSELLVIVPQSHQQQAAFFPENRVKHGGLPVRNMGGRVDRPAH